MKDVMVVRLVNVFADELPDLKLRKAWEVKRVKGLTLLDVLTSLLTRSTTRS